MERREFFNRLIWGTAAIAVAPALLLDEIAEHEYPLPPEELFVDGEGLWVFKDRKLVAFGAKQGVTLEWNREMFDVIPHPLFCNEEDMGYRDFIPGKIDAWYNVSSLELIDPSILDNWRETTFPVIMKTNEYLLNSDVYMSEWAMSISEYETQRIHTKFLCVGATTIELQEG